MICVNRTLSKRAVEEAMSRKIGLRGANLATCEGSDAVVLPEICQKMPFALSFGGVMSCSEQGFNVYGLGTGEK